MKTFLSFEKLCLRRCKLLETRFEFKVAKVERENYGVFITYQNSTTFIQASFEPREGGVFVSIGRLVDGHIPPYPVDVKQDTILHWFDLNDLLALRAPQASLYSGEWPSEKKLDEVLKGIADALRTHAADVLKGDFTVFKELDQVVKERARKMKA